MEIIKTMTTFLVTQNQEIEIVKKEIAENSVSVIAKSEREAANDEGTGRAKMPKTIQRDFLVAHRYTICDGMCALRGVLQTAIACRWQSNFYLPIDKIQFLKYN